MDQVISLLFEYGPWAAVAIAVWFVYQKFIAGASVRMSAGGFDDLLAKLLGQGYRDRQLDRFVQQEKSRGSFLSAGRLYEETGRLPQAAEIYLEGQEYHAAASVLEKLGKLERAAELYLQGGDYKKAANIFTDAGKPAKAAALFLEKGNTLEAARLFGLAGEWSKAADLYVKSGYPLRAAEAYEKKGDFLKAAECQEKHFTENVSYATTYSATASSVDHKSALLAGRLYEKAGDLNHAFQIYSKGSFFKEAAGALTQLGQHAKAAELYMRAEDPDSAASAFERAGDSVRASNLRGEVALKQDRVPDAARFFQAGQDYLRAAELFESISMLAEAAGAYEAGESYNAAANVYVRAGLKDRAAQSYERGGEFETAAKFYEESGNNGKAIELYEKAGLTFKSGEAAAKAGERDRAISLLQRVPATDENYRTATELLAQLFIENRMPGLAVERLQKVLGSDPVSPSNLDLYYWLAAGQEASGNAPQALMIYKKILSEDLRYRDVEKRVARLTAAGVAARPTQAAASATGPLGGAPGGFERRAAATPAPVAAPTPAPRAPKPPRFTRKDEIGKGPLGVVYRAEDTSDGRSVAYRVLPVSLLRGEGVATALVNDLKAAASFSHPNVAKVLGIVDSGGERCVISELVQGRNFAEALRSGHKMTFQQAHGLGRVLAGAVGGLHAKGLIHGSIQPSNIMVAAGVVKLTDMGLARLAYAVAPADHYRAPENSLDKAGDLYALAAVLYHLLTGVHPRSQAQGAALPLPSKLAPGVPEAFDKLLIRCLHPRTELRLAAAEDMLRELKDMVRIG
jgi:tetratricopeptide (TPR) repeat protein